MDTQWVCDPTRVKVCICAGGDDRLAEFNCDCDSTPDVAKQCARCGSPMVLINVDTGEPVEAVAS